MLSKADIKYINSLQNKKYRKIEHAFVVEGLKNVVELLKSDYVVLRLFSTAAYQHELQNLCKHGLQVEVLAESELLKIGTLENNQSTLAIAKVKEESGLKEVFEQKLTVVLDNINDPGNLGTIIRLADWYGIKHVVCSPETVDFYNPKVVQASKGSFTRVRPHYVSLNDFFSKNPKTPVYAACMEGKPIYGLQKPNSAILVLGNEANGISEEVLSFAQNRITIPRIGGAESLNVGVAAGILMDRFLGGE
jgi:RNA methyltransferase, TrmH family